jgi:hypothetical protein
MVMAQLHLVASLLLGLLALWWWEPAQLMDLLPTRRVWAPELECLDCRADWMVLPMAMSLVISLARQRVGACLVLAKRCPASYLLAGVSMHCWDQALPFLALHQNPQLSVHENPSTAVHANVHPTMQWMLF